METEKIIKKEPPRSADSVLDEILDVVDGSQWPRSWPLNGPVSCVLEDSLSYSAMKSFETPSSRKNDEDWNTSLNTVRDREKILRLAHTERGLIDLWYAIDDSCGGRLGDQEIVPMACSYAAGLLAGGLSKSQAKPLLRLFLKNYLY